MKFVAQQKNFASKRWECDPQLHHPYKILQSVNKKLCVKKMRLLWKKPVCCPIDSIDSIRPRNIAYNTGDVVEFRRDKGAGWMTSIGTLGEHDIEHDSEFASGNKPHHHRLPSFSPSGWTVKYLEGASNWRGPAPLPSIPEICLVGHFQKDVKKAHKGMLGQDAFDERRVACGTVVSVNVTTGFLLLRDGDAQHRPVHISDDVTLEGDGVKPKLNGHGNCPIQRCQ